MINYLGAISVSATEAPGPFGSISSMYDISMFKALTYCLGFASCAKGGEGKEICSVVNYGYLC